MHGAWIAFMSTSQPAGRRHHGMNLGQLRSVIVWLPSTMPLGSFKYYIATWSTLHPHTPGPPLSLVMFPTHTDERSWGRPGRLPSPGQLCYESPQVARYDQGQVRWQY
jgi:hypothetical protein